MQLRSFFKSSKLRTVGDFRTGKSRKKLDCKNTAKRRPSSSLLRPCSCADDATASCKRSSKVRRVQKCILCLMDVRMTKNSSVVGKSASPVCNMTWSKVILAKYLWLDPKYLFRPPAVRLKRLGFLESFPSEQGKRHCSKSSWLVASRKIGGHHPKMKGKQVKKRIKHI